MVDHLAVDLTLEPTSKSIEATATLSIRRVDPEARELHLDATGFELSSVKLGDSAVPYTYDGRALLITIGENVATSKVSISYKATPRRGMYFLEPDEHVTDRPRQVWTQCQEEDARHWLPCVDKPHVKMTTEMRARVPNGWYVLSNGELSDRTTPTEGPNEGLSEFHWKMNEPHPSYLLTLVAGEFSELTAKAGNVPLSYYVPKGKEVDGERTFARTPQMIEHFSEITGVPYPWNKYAQIVVSDFIFGGMENTTATTMYEHILLDARAAIDITSDDLIAHELAHQWFGDYVTCRDWSEAWLNEGFATYMEHVWREKHLGRDEHDYGIKVDLESYTGEAASRYKRPIVCLDYDAPLDLFDRHLYEKGGLVLHMLRVELGTDLFWRGVNRYLTRHAKGGVETRDLQRALEEVSGRSLGRFFEQWITKPGHPEVEVALAWDKSVLTATVKQHQATADGVPATFEFPLYIEIGMSDKSTRREKVLVTQKSELFALPCKDRPLYVVVDPEMRILGDVTVKAPNDMLRAQLANAKTARGRWLAANALATSDDRLTIAALSASLENEDEFWGTRCEAAEALGKIHAREAEETLVRAASIKHPKVRRSVVAALGKFKSNAVVDALKSHALRDESYLVEAEAARSLGRTKQPAAFDTLLDVIDRPSWSDVIRAGAIDGLALLRDDRGAPHILSRMRYGHPVRSRRSAILALPKLMGDRKAREALEDLLNDSDPHLRIEVARSLQEMGDVKARGALRARLDVDLDPRVRRRLREVLRDLGSETKRGQDQLREEFEKLQNEHAELKSRIAKIEAASSANDSKGASTSATSAAPVATAKKAVSKKAPSKKVALKNKRKR